MKKMPLIVVVLLAWPLACPAAQDNAAQSSPRRPVARTQQEYDDYRSAAIAGSGAALEKAAADFAQKYPQSELRRLLFSRTVRQYQCENDPAGMLAAGESVLALDPNDSLALVLTATVLADSLTAGDPDRDKKITEIKGRVARALHSLETGFVAPDSATPQQAALYRTTLQSTAYSALGIMKLKTGDDAGAEKDLKTGAELAKVRPDPYIWYHLALAQDHRRKYRAALNSVEQALQLASANPQLQRLAEAEHERLNKQAGRAKDSSAASGGSQPPE